MCGFAGFLDLTGTLGSDQLALVATDMALAIEHRGPDDRSVWTDQAAGYSVAFQRLSIRDLSEAGQQPMVSTSKRYIIAFNGEVYSADRLRARLQSEGATFRGHSDTEVILESIDRRGLEATLPELVGMFAISLWDRDTRELTLVRDRMGIKPLYYGFGEKCFVFGSQPKCFFSAPGWSPEVDRNVLASYLRFAYVPSPSSIYAGVSQVAPGEMVCVKEGKVTDRRTYWDFKDVARTGVSTRATFDDADAIQKLDSLLGEAVEDRLVSDVPLGAFLSGGIDSSVVAALMQKRASSPIETFSIGFAEEEFNEAIYAKAVADHLGTKHHEMYVTAQDALDVIPKIPTYYDEPFADSSQIPTYLLSKLTKDHVTVALSGDGGDELFAGYTRYQMTESMMGGLSRLPPFVLPLISTLARRTPDTVWDLLHPMVPKKYGVSPLRTRVKKAEAILKAGAAEQAFRQIVGQWQEPDQLVKGGVEQVDALWEGELRETIPDVVERMQCIDTLTYLPDDILTKVDRASMAVSLEARVPLIDHRVVEFVWSLPKHLKVRNGETKWLLRQVLYQYVPRELIDRPKMGFGVPIDLWLRGELRDWAEHLLDEKRLEEEGIFNPRPIREKFEQHLSGEISWHYMLWTILMFQAWKEQWASA